MLDILLVNGRYPDFRAGEMKSGNIGIKDGKIDIITEGEPKAAQVIDVSGRVVSPGFIDIHMHEEDFAGEGLNYCIADMMLRMGVTTAVGGNCGIQHQTLKEFKSGIQKLGGSPVNYQMLAGYNQCRYRLGTERYAAATQEERKRIREMLAAELEEGAIGISFGIEYDPGMTTDEILYAAKVTENPGHLIAAHYRSDNDKALDAIGEMIQVTDAICSKFQISHLSSCAAMGQMTDALNLIHEAMDRNPRLNYDTYPYDAFSTHMGSSVFEDGCLEAWHRSYDSILLTEEPYLYQRCTKEMFEDARENYPDMLAVAFVMNEEEIRQAVADPYGMIASDAIINQGAGHPRAAGTFPRVLGKYVRQEHALSLIDALRKISFTPAERLGLRNKGRVEEGADADLTVFDPETIIDKATFTDGGLPPAGIDYVFVNGGIAARGTEIVDGRRGGFIPYHD